MLLNSCSTAGKEAPEQGRETPPVKIEGTALRFQSYFFTAPQGYQILEDAQGAHVAGVFSEVEGAKLVKRLSSRRGFALTSAPTATCRNGETARVEILREFKYATEYDPPSLPEKWDEQGGVGPVTPAHPTSFETRNLGLEASFQGRKAGPNIEFSFQVSRTSFLGFVNYGSPITTPGKGLFGQSVNVVVTENRIEMPVFDLRRVSSAVIMRSGQYLALEGLSPDLQPALEGLTARQREAMTAPENLLMLIRVELFE